MRIIYPVNKRLITGRAHDVLIIRTCYALAESGLDVVLIIGKTMPERQILSYYGLKPHKNLSIMQLPVIRKTGRFGISWHFVFNRFVLRKILQLLSDGKESLLYLSELKMALFLLKHKKRINIPFFYEIHGLYASYPDAENYPCADNEEGKVFSLSDRLITTTGELNKIIKETYPGAKDISVVPLAAEKVSAFKSARGGEFKVYYIGQLYYEQGIDLLMKVARKLENVQFHIIGGKKEEVLSYREAAARENIEKRVFFHGFVKPSEIDEAVKEADCFVIPSRQKGKMNYVAHTKSYEYLRYGKPVVSFRLDSVLEVLKDNYNALLAERDNPDSLAECIIKLENDDDLRNKLSAGALKTLEEFSWSERAEKLKKVFNVN
ncbi:glycosyltransferase family 4 protein [bacterium]|jgi:glycosyltransferase involved in cell wall biosynthesis|nr:glycosyltransferase family 4 protein [bacterium]